MRSRSLMASVITCVGFCTRNGTSRVGARPGRRHTRCSVRGRSRCSDRGDLFRCVDGPGVDGSTRRMPAKLRERRGAIQNLRGVWNNSTTTPFERLTDAEQEQGRLAREPVQRATGGTRGGLARARQRTGARLAHRRSAGWTDPGASSGSDSATRRSGERADRPRRGRFLARPKQLGAMHFAHPADRDDSERLQRELPDAEPRGDPSWR